MWIVKKHLLDDRINIKLFFKIDSAVIASCELTEIDNGQ